MERAIAVLLGMGLLVFDVASAFAYSEGYQQYFHHSDKYPDMVQNTGFHNEANGIAHDDDYWYITNNADNNPILWKIPVTQNLYGIGFSTPGVSWVRNDTVSCPTKDGPKTLGNDLKYNHYGDLVAYKRENDNQYYLLVPIEGGIPGYAIAVFRAHDLQCLGFDVLRTNNNNPPSLNDSAAWCATDKKGYVYTSPDKWSFAEWNGEVKLLKYSLNWDTLGSDPQNPVYLTYLETIPIKKEDGSTLFWTEISGVAQGGEFSPDGKLLYVSSGTTQMNEEYGGIHVFNTNPWTRVARSDTDANALFKYDFNSGWSKYEEPEGLTIWDLEEQRASYLDPDKAPYIQGQLHVLLLQNYVWQDPASGDAVYLYHYTNTTYVDHAYAYGFTPDGTIGRPFRTVGEALAFYNQNEYFNHGHWTEGRIKIHTGSYREV